jgi:hypothetical protein
VLESRRTEGNRISASSLVALSAVNPKKLGSLGITAAMAVAGEVITWRPATAGLVRVCALTLGANVALSATSPTFTMPCCMARSVVAETKMHPRGLDASVIY